MAPRLSQLSEADSLAGAIRKVSRGFVPVWSLLKKRSTALVCVSLLTASLWIGCSGFADSGPLWPDGPQYANAGAMIHDWLKSGRLLHPYEFAKENYARLPAFHLPYHPPFYPGLLGLFFTVTGVSYFAARVFVAICLALSGCFFYLILIRSDIRRGPSFACSLLLITLPEVAFWSRDTMSEIPGLWLILAATYFFLVWMTTDRKSAYWAAFAFAGAAFFSRFLTAGILPAWFIWALLAGKFRKLLAPWAIAPPLLYLVTSGLWVAAVIPFSKYETIYGGSPPNTNYASTGSVKIAAYYASHLGAMLGWPALIAACLGLLCIAALREQGWRELIWLPWLLSYVIFLEFVGIYQEPRYFIYALPAFVGLIAALARTRARYLFAAAAGICLVWNVAAIPAFPRGMVGYEALGRKLARMPDRGNILISTIGQADLMFRYRSQPADLKRTFIRGDRTLAIRPPSYSNAATKVIVRNDDDLLDIIHKGRIRYVVTCSTAPGSADVRTPEMAFLDEAARAHPDRFELVGAYPLRAGYSGALATVRLWRFTGEIPNGDNEIEVVVPTANLKISPPR